MSVLVRGMKMPDCCANCPFQILEREKYISFQYEIDASECEICDGFMTEHESYSKMLPKCPLVEVPPHGRLIDADAYRKEIRERYESAREWYKGAKTDDIKARAESALFTFTECSLTIRKMPTIIEADSDVMFYPQVDGITPTVIKGEAEDET